MSKILLLPGDGIGPEVVEQAVKVLEVVGKKHSHNFSFETARVGGASIDKYGVSLTDETLNLAFSSKAILLGAVGGPKWDDPKAVDRPENGLLRLRKELGLYANIRPVKVYVPLLDQSPLKREVIKDVDILFVRELIGGLYFGKPKHYIKGNRGWRATDTMNYAEHQIERILRLAFEIASSRKRKLLHSVDKMNVLETSRLWRKVANDVAKSYPNVKLVHMLVDNTAMQLIRNPRQFDVVVTENTFGDILTDEASAIAGSLGMLPSASLPKPKRIEQRSIRTLKPALYEPVHGSAPEIAGNNVANPLGAILSVAMMLRSSFGLEKESKAIESAVSMVLEGDYFTDDIAFGKPSVTTSEMGKAVLERL